MVYCTAAMARSRKSYIANHVPAGEVPFARAPSTTRAAAAAAPAKKLSASCVSLPLFRAPCRRPSQPVATANTTTSSMFCLTNRAAVAAAPAAATSQTAARVFRRCRPSVTSSTPPATKGAARSSPSTGIEPVNGVARAAQATAAPQRPARGPLTTWPAAPTARTVHAAAKHPRSLRPTVPPDGHQPQEKSYQQRRTVNPVVPIQRRPRMPLPGDGPRILLRRESGQHAGTETERAQPPTPRPPRPHPGAASPTVARPRTSRPNLLTAPREGNLDERHATQIARLSLTGA